MYSHSRGDMRKCLCSLDLRKMRVVLITGCKFPYSYTGLHNERRPEEGGELQTECAPQEYGISLITKSTACWKFEYHTLPNKRVHSVTFNDIRQG